ncbi:hypothetical protein PSH03_003761 [Micromonospora sp. PSH03]|uniref:hypothetical protein n=1 Tax=Micromonospora salmantinae TaxID=2911211 RepID=UPI001EE90C4C|nr:hypothetical protein [Micromonospora salmantinae]MCG5454601.1 hypothetical protein [Micromonospora salmantinae]
MTNVGQRLATIRGGGAASRHNARTIAALTTNPGCARRAVLDCASVDKQRLAAYIDYPARFGQSQFAITRGNAFEAQVKANGCAQLLQLLRERLDLEIPEVSYDDLESVAGRESQDVRYARSRALLTRAAAQAEGAGTLFDHPLLRLEVAGQQAYLEPDLIAFQHDGQFHVVEIKSFAVIDGQADSGKVAGAAIQAAVYVLAMRELLGDAGFDPEIVSHDVVLVCPRDFSNQPMAVRIDVRKQLAVLRRQLSRMTRIDALLANLPATLTFDFAPDDSGVPTRSPASLVAALEAVEARYSPECLASCELAYFCRHEARGCTAALGKSAREEMGGIERVETALAIARNQLAPSEDQEEAAELLRAAARLRAELISGVAG